MSYISKGSVACTYFLTEEGWKGSMHVRRMFLEFQDIFSGAMEKSVHVSAISSLKANAKYRGGGCKQQGLSYFGLTTLCTLVYRTLFTVTPYKCHNCTMKCSTECIMKHLTRSLTCFLHYRQKLKARWHECTVEAILVEESFGFYQRNENNS